MAYSTITLNVRESTVDGHAPEFVNVWVYPLSSLGVRLKTITDSGGRKVINGHALVRATTNTDLVQIVLPDPADVTLNPHAFGYEVRVATNYFNHVEFVTPAQIADLLVAGVLELESFTSVVAEVDFDATLTYATHGDLTVETTRAEAAEDANAAAIADEAARAVNAENLLAPKASPALTGNPTAPTQTPGNNSTRLATTAYADAAVALEATNRATAITTAVNNLVNGAPGALDTLKELADAVNDDASFAASVTTALAAKVPQSRLLAGLDLTVDRSASDLVTALGSALSASIAAGTTGKQDHSALDADVSTAVADTTSATAAALSLPAHRLVSGNEPRGTIAWTFDDGYSHAVGYFGLMDARGIKGTLFLTQLWVDQAGTQATWNDTYITHAQVQTIAGNGHEIGTHGYNHESVVNYRNSNGDAALAALYDGIANFIETGFTGPGGAALKVHTGAYPAGANDRRTREIIGRRHNFFRATQGVVAQDGWDPYAVPGIDVQTYTLAQLKAFIDTAYANDTLVVFLTHGVTGGTPTTRAAQLTNVAAAMDYATSLGVRQTSFGQAMTERTMRRSPGVWDDTSGHSYRLRSRTQRLSWIRSDTVAAEAWAEIDTVNNALYFDGTNGQPVDFRAGARITSTFHVGRRKDYSGTTTNGSPSVLIPLLSVDASVVGITITGPGIPAGALVGSQPDATHLSMVDVDGVTPVNAGAGAGLGTITLGWPTAPTSNINGPAVFNGAVRATGAAASTGYTINNLDGTQTLLVKAGGITRSTSGTFNIDTAGGNLELEAGRVRMLADNAAAAHFSVGSALPLDASIDNGETVVYPDPATGTLLYKGKDSGGTVFGPYKLARTSKRVFGIADTATLTVDANSYDAAKVTALAQAMTIAAPTGSPTAVQPLIIRVKDNGTAQGLTWNAAFRAVGTTLPTSTVLGKTVYVGAVWNADDSKWDVIAVAQQA